MFFFLFESENTVSNEQSYGKFFPQNEASVKRNMTERYVTENLRRSTCHIFEKN